jgi:hypothetical protein
LGVVDIMPSVVTPELAAAALASPALSRARELSGADDVTTDPEEALRSWLRAFAPKLGLPPEPGLPDEPCGRCLTVLTELADAADGIASTQDLLDAVRLAFPTPDSPDDLARELRHAVSAIADLLSFAAAVPAVEEPEDDNRVRLTPLGRMLAESVFAALAIDPAADVETVVRVFAEQPPAVSMSIARPWLAARTPTAAVREVLGFAESAITQQRTVAVSLAKEIGPEAAQAWREYAGADGFGAYAREWLAQRGEEVAADPRDQAWLTVEAISVAEVSLPSEAVSDMIGSAAGRAELGDLAGILTMLRESGHPDAERVAEAISKAASLRARPGPAEPAGLATVVRIQPRAKNAKKKAKRQR